MPKPNGLRGQVNIAECVVDKAPNHTHPHSHTRVACRAPHLQSPEDVPKPNGLRGQVNIAECVVDDLDERGQARHPGSPPLSSTDKAHWMMRVRHKV